MQLSQINPETAQELLRLSLEAGSNPEICIPDRYRCFFVASRNGWRLSDEAFDAVMEVQGVHFRH
ncbi:MAG: hypothetical protein JO171_14445 [Paludibacterium sp.]|uniref:hypothetical protein n=1 Tax=Paludibacterium sp. TaxID=1917523 RepID=UPI0025CC928B|nr:hypothetical protein [Paludibacterium sp.]MBV8048352.1 hypothetical protein [Paludibacterium sp.]MBV8469531.1 hypothetical protein [Burkholderiaceae bacterium]MBV8647094.1 hypothetical protein [Paludibacterium sp.]